MEGILDLLDSRLRLVSEQCVHTHDNTRGTEPTLGTMAFGNSLLKKKRQITHAHVGRNPTSPAPSYLLKAVRVSIRPLSPSEVAQIPHLHDGDHPTNYSYGFFFKVIHIKLYFFLFFIPSLFLSICLLSNNARALNILGRDSIIEYL